MSRTRVGGALAAVVALVVLVLLAFVETGADDRSAATPATPAPTAAPSPGASTRDPESGLGWVDLSALPPQARQTVTLIEAGGPFPYAKDGAPFGNREGLLPRQRSGFYREYTVPTPGESDRGARRIVAGDGVRQLFYTGDHYASFVRIRR